MEVEAGSTGPDFGIAGRHEQRFGHFVGCWQHGVRRGDPGFQCEQKSVHEGLWCSMVHFALLDPGDGGAVERFNGRHDVPVWS